MKNYYENKNKHSYEEDYAYENEYDTCKPQENTQQKIDKQRAISCLRKCNYKTAPRKIAIYLEILFNNRDTYEDYWLHVAQHWTPKSINSVIKGIIKQHQRGDATIKNPAAYFVHTIKFHPKRKKFRSANGGQKNQT